MSFHLGGAFVQIGRRSIFPNGIPAIDFENTKFEKNHATKSGGGIHITDHGDVRFDCPFDPKNVTDPSISFKDNIGDCDQFIDNSVDDGYGSQVAFDASDIVTIESVVNRSEEHYTTEKDFSD